WSRYGAVHAYAPAVAGASLARLHRLRIAGKRLRYLLEGFEEILGGDAKAVIEPLKELQDALGKAHDADVAAGLIQAFMATYAGPSDHVEPYLDYQRSVILASRARFEQLWPALIGEERRRQLAVVVASL